MAAVHDFVSLHGGCGSVVEGPALNVSPSRRSEPDLRHSAVFGDGGVRAALGVPLGDVATTDGGPVGSA